MRRVPFIDSTGIHNLETLINASKNDGIHVVLSGVVPSVKDVLLHAHIDRLIGEDHICDNITEAVELANKIAVE
jgi:SulP family sulfate permease